MILGMSGSFAVQLAKPTNIVECHGAFSGISFTPQVVGIRTIRLESRSVSLAQLALMERPPLAIGVAGNHHRANAPAADRAPRRVTAQVWNVDLRNLLPTVRVPTFAVVTSTCGDRRVIEGIDDRAVSRSKRDVCRT